MIFQNEKTHFQALKTTISKSRNIDIFMVSLQNCPFFHLFFFGNIVKENVFNDILERKNAFLGNKNKKFKKSQNCHFCKGVNPCFCSKIGYFSIFFFQAIQATKSCFMIYQNEKTHFQAIKTRSSKRRKIDIFAKGLTHGFAPKLAIFPSFSFRQYRPGKCVF